MRKWEVDLTLIEAWIDTLEGSAHPNMKELRPRTTKGGAHIRMLFAFDIQSRAIMLVAGDKAGNWTKWYATNLPVADRLFSEHQEKFKQADAAKAAKPKTRKGKRR